MRNLLKVIVFLSILFLIRSTVTVGQVSYNNGASSAYVAQTGGKNGKLTVSGSSVILGNGARGYFTNSYRDSFASDMFILFHLLGKKLSFTVDLHEAGCGCNAAMYFTSMPAYGSNQKPDPTKCGDYYCDANTVCGIACPEMDIIEANNNGIQITPHKCSSPSGKHYNWCDKGGCGQNVQKKNPSVYGWGSSHLINTQRPFDIEMTFKATNNQLTSIDTVIKQEGRSHTVVHSDSNCGGGYLGDLTKPLENGMVIILSYWGDSKSGNDMTWLDAPPCKASVGCNQGSHVTFSNIAVN